MDARSEHSESAMEVPGHTAATGLPPTTNLCSRADLLVEHELAEDEAAEDEAAQDEAAEDEAVRAPCARRENGKERLDGYPCTRCGRVFFTPQAAGGHARHCLENATQVEERYDSGAAESSDEEFHHRVRKPEPQRAQPTRLAKIVGYAAWRLEPRIGTQFQVAVARWSPTAAAASGGDSMRLWTHLDDHEEPLLIPTASIDAEIAESAERRLAGHVLERSSQEQYEYIDARYVGMGAARAVLPTADGAATTTSSKELAAKPTADDDDYDRDRRRRDRDRRGGRDDRKGGAPTGRTYWASSSSTLPGEAIILGAVALPDAYRDASCRMRPNGMPPWPPAEKAKGRTPAHRRGPLTKSMVLALRGYPRRRPTTRLRRDNEAEEEAPPPPPPVGWKWPRDGDCVEIEVEEEEGTVWKPAAVVAVLTDGWFSARMLHDDEWVDWFTWQEEGKDWRRSAVASAGGKRKVSAVVSASRGDGEGLEEVGSSTASAVASAKGAGAVAGAEHAGGGGGGRGGGGKQMVPKSPRQSTKRVRSIDGAPNGADLGADEPLAMRRPKRTSDESTNAAIEAARRVSQRDDLEETEALARPEAQPAVQPEEQPEEQPEKTKAEEEAEVEADRAAVAAAMRDRVSIPAPGTMEHELAGGGIEVGMGCEVEMEEDGLTGSRFSAAICQLWPLSTTKGKKKVPTQALVQYDTLYEDQKSSMTKPAHLREWVPLASLLAVPPLPPDDWITRVLAGDELDGLYEGGWWRVVVLTRGKDTSEPFVTEVVGYDGLQRTFCAADLRPPLGSRLLNASTSPPITTPITTAPANTNAACGMAETVWIACQAAEERPLATTPFDTTPFDTTPLATTALAAATLATTPLATTALAAAALKRPTAEPSAKGPQQAAQQGYRCGRCGLPKKGHVCLAGTAVATAPPVSAEARGQGSQPFGNLRGIATHAPVVWAHAPAIYAPTVGPAPAPPPPPPEPTRARSARPAAAAAAVAARRAQEGEDDDDDDDEEEEEEEEEAPVRPPKKPKAPPPPPPLLSAAVAAAKAAGANEATANAIAAAAAAAAAAAGIFPQSGTGEKN